MGPDRDVWRLLEALNRIDGAYYLWARRRGINENRLMVLYYLDGRERCSQKEISDAWLIPKTTVNTVVRQLEQEGLVTLEAHGREKTVALTAAGRAYAKGLVCSMKAAERHALASAAAAYGPQFIDAFEHFAGILCRELQEDKESQ